MPLELLKPELRFGGSLGNNCSGGVDVCLYRCSMNVRTVTMWDASKEQMCWALWQWTVEVVILTVILMSDIIMWCRCCLLCITHTHTACRPIMASYKVYCVDWCLLPLLLSKWTFGLMERYEFTGTLFVASSSSRMRFLSHNWSATKRCLHPQIVAEISRHSVLSGDRIRQCETLSGLRHKDADQCL